MSSKKKQKKPETLNYDVYKSPIGLLTVLSSTHGLCEILFENESKETHVSLILNKTNPHNTKAIKELKQYFDHQLTQFTVTLDLRGTEFQKQAWTVLQQIKYGQTIPYEEQAGRLGDTKKARAVGSANGKNPLPIIIPCHRVIAKNGSMSGYSGGVTIKEWLLNHEKNKDLIK
jgi:O-6-methylguanine DNA methyltransferase